MGTTHELLKSWLARGRAQSATHLIVVCDTFSHEDYPVFVQPGEDVNAKVQEFRAKNMQRVQEVYDLALDDASQLAEKRAFNSF